MESFNLYDTNDSTGGMTCVTPFTWTYSYPQYQPDKTRQAFKILKMLEKKKLLTIKTVSEFVDLVDEIYKIL